MEPISPHVQNRRRSKHRRRSRHSPTIVGEIIRSRSPSPSPSPKLGSKIGDSPGMATVSPLVRAGAAERQRAADGVEAKEAPWSQYSPAGSYKDVAQEDPDNPTVDYDPPSDNDADLESGSSCVDEY
jgi:hypothetical protein